MSGAGTCQTPCCPRQARSALGGGHATFAPRLGLTLLDEPPRAPGRRRELADVPDVNSRPGLSVPHVGYVLQNKKKGGPRCLGDNSTQPSTRQGVRHERPILPLGFARPKRDAPSDATQADAHAGLDCSRWRLAWSGGVCGGAAVVWRAWSDGVCSRYWRRRAGGKIVMTGRRRGARHPARDSRGSRKPARRGGWWPS